MYKNSKGITLIALVVTIIVLLILAGVTLAMLTGSNGVLTNAQKSKRETSQAEAEEKINLALNSIRTEIYANQVENKTYSGLNVASGVYTVDGKITNILKNDLTGSDVTVTSGASDATIKAQADGWKFYLDETSSTPVDGTGSTASKTSGTLTIAYKNTNDDFYTSGKITLTNNTADMTMQAATSNKLTEETRTNN